MTLAMTLAVVKSDDRELWLAVILLALIIGLDTAFWFASNARSSFKLGAGFIGIVATGSLMIFSQLLTLGLLTLAVGGGALGGYLMRVRQEVTSRQKEALAIIDGRKPIILFLPVKDDSS